MLLMSEVPLYRSDAPARSNQIQLEPPVRVTGVPCSKEIATPPGTTIYP